MIRVHLNLQKLARRWNTGGKTAKRWGQKNPGVVYAQRYPKDIKKVLRLHVVARKASATPPLGPTLGQYGIPIMKFCDQFNATPYKFKRNTKLVVILSQTYDNDYYFDIHLPTTSVLLRKVARMRKGSGQAGQVSNKEYLIELKAIKFAEDEARRKAQEDVNAKHDEKYGYLDKRARSRARKKGNIRGRKKRPKKKSYFTKHINVVGITRCAGITPQMLYEVCVLKYVQYINCGLDAFDMAEFDFRYSKRKLSSTERELPARVEPKNVSVEFKYRNAIRTYEQSDAYYMPAASVYATSALVMRSLFRLCKGTMRSMGLFSVPITPIMSDSSQCLCA